MSENDGAVVENNGASDDTKTTTTTPPKRSKSKKSPSTEHLQSLTVNTASSATSSSHRTTSHRGGGKSSSSSTAPLVLDVGGTVFKTTSATLTSIPGTYFERTLQSNKHKDEVIALAALTSQLQPLFIDRDPEFYIFVLNYMRDGPAAVMPDREHVRARVQQEAYFYGCGVD